VHRATTKNFPSTPQILVLHIRLLEDWPNGTRHNSLFVQCLVYPIIRSVSPLRSAADARPPVPHPPFFIIDNSWTSPSPMLTRAKGTQLPTVPCLAEHGQ
jgi:hypothetical protein